MTVNPQDADSHPPPVAEANTKLVLVVDDSKLQRRILSGSLSRWGYEVIEAESAEVALELCRARSPGLILSDWVMPGMTGIEFCSKFRELAGDNYGYFILLTSKSDKNEVAEGLDAGADDFLTKPVDGNELRARMTAGERILEMQRELTLKNQMITETLDELQRVYDSLDNDLIEAKKLQQSLVPERFKSFPGADLSLLLRSSGHVGGDLVGHFPAAPGHLGIFAIDVSGHGISSALMTARLAGFLSGSALDQNIALEKISDGQYRSRPPAEAIETLNELVLDEMDTEHYFTLLLADVDLCTGRVVVGQAGHPHPVVQKPGGKTTPYGEGGFPVGLMSGVIFSEFEIQLSPGDRLLILSDGVTECPGPGDDMMGETGFYRRLERMKDIGGPALFDEIISEMTKFAGHSEFPDDVSGILLEFSGRAETESG